MIEPTTADVRGWTTLATLTAAAQTQADLWVGAGKSLFLKLTGLTWATVPLDDEPAVKRAVTGMSEMTTVQSQPEYLETLSDFDLIQNFSAGPYSETRRSPEDAFKARMLVAWPWLNSLLWDLMTPDKYDYWVAFFSGRVAPAFETQEVDWGWRGTPRGDWLVDDGRLYGA